MKFFGRRQHDGRAELARIASFDALAAQQPASKTATLPVVQAPIRVLSDEELFGTGGGAASLRETGKLGQSSEPLTHDQLTAVPTPEPDLHAWRDTEPAPLESDERAEPGPSLVTTEWHDRVPAAGAASTLIGEKVLIGGEEADLVPLIPNTKPEAESAELDDETSTAAAVDALRGACHLLVDRVHRMSAMNDGARFISAMIVVVSELDAKYATDWGIVRRNGLEEVLADVRAAVSEGDRFILESLENGNGGFTAEAFVRDLKTVAVKDRPRILAEYTIFLVFVYHCVLRQYLRPLEHDSARLQEMMGRLEYLIDGVREILIQHVNAHIRG